MLEARIRINVYKTQYIHINICQCRVFSVSHSCECLNFTICYFICVCLCVFSDIQTRQVYGRWYRRRTTETATSNQQPENISHVSKWRGPGRLMHKYVNNAQPRIFFIGSAGPGRWHLTYGRGFGRTGSMPHERTNYQLPTTNVQRVLLLIIILYRCTIRVDPIRDVLLILSRESILEIHGSPSPSPSPIPPYVMLFIPPFFLSTYYALMFLSYTYDCSCLTLALADAGRRAASPNSQFRFIYEYLILSRYTKIPLASTCRLSRVLDTRLYPTYLHIFSFIMFYIILYYIRCLYFFN